MIWTSSLLGCGGKLLPACCSPKAPKRYLSKLKSTGGVALLLFSDSMIRCGSEVHQVQGTRYRKQGTGSTAMCLGLLSHLNLGSVSAHSFLGAAYGNSP